MKEEGSMEKATMKAAVLGVNGYLGKHLAHFLAGKGWQVHGYGRAERGVLPDMAYTRLDIRNKEDFGRLELEGVDFVFYFPGLTGTIRGYDDYENYIDTNEKGLLHLMDRLREEATSGEKKATSSELRAASQKEVGGREDGSAGVAKVGRGPRVVYPSTRLVYKGVKDRPLSEDAEKEFKTLYALNKWFGECLLHQYAAYYDIPFSIFRICVPYANLFEGAYSYGTVGFFLGKAAGRQPITVFGEGEPKRSFTHVEDICRQIFYALQAPSSVNGVLNIAGETFSLREVADAIGKKYAVATTLMPWPEIDKKLESGDTIFDSSRIGQILNNPLQNSFAKWLSSIG